jgi:hypothetical protein
MPGFFETLERDDEAHRLARELAGGCPRCERSLLPLVRQQVWCETSRPEAVRDVLKRHRRHLTPLDGGAQGRRRDPGPDRRNRGDQAGV